MTLIEEMERSGGWLFRWRSYLPLFVLALLVGSIVAYRPDLDARVLDDGWEAVCLSIGLLGLGIRLLTVGYSPPGTSGRNTRAQVARSLSTTGPYSVARHPLYLGNLLMWLGPALYPRLWWLALLVVLIFWLHYERIMLAEERFLREKFGSAFTEWARRTPAIIPRPWLWRPPSPAFSIRKALRREASSYLGLVSTLAALELTSGLALEGRVEVDPVWIALLAPGVALSILVRLTRRPDGDARGGIRRTLRPDRHAISGGPRGGQVEP